MRPSISLLVVVLVVASAVRASAQVVVVEEEEVGEEVIVERGYVRGVGRGIQYGVHLISPIYLMPMDRGDGVADRLGHGPGAGLHGRIGWEFPSGFTIEIYGGFALKAVDFVAGEAPDRGHVLSQASVGAGLRYMFFNETAVVPFVQVGAGGRWFWFQWTDGEPVDAQGTIARTGAVGLQIELSPFFGIEAGALVDYTFGMDVFREGFVSITPFLGVTLYLYDEND